MKETNLKIFILAITVLGLTGCGATGKKFQALEGAENNKSIVYFYRADQFGGSWRTINVMEVKASSMAKLNEESKATTEVKNDFSEDEEKNDYDENTIGSDDIDQVGKLRNNSYHKKEFEPGLHYFTTNWLYDPEEFHLEPNDYICIRADMEYFKMAFGSYAPLTKIDKQLCTDEIKDTRELTAEDEGNIFY